MRKVTSVILIIISFLVFGLGFLFSIIGYAFSGLRYDLIETSRIMGPSFIVFSGILFMIGDILGYHTKEQKELNKRQGKILIIFGFLSGGVGIFFLYISQFYALWSPTHVVIIYTSAIYLVISLIQVFSGMFLAVAHRLFQREEALNQNGNDTDSIRLQNRCRICEKEINEDFEYCDSCKERFFHD